MKSAFHRLALSTASLFSLGAVFLACQSSSPDPVEPTPTSERTSVVVAYSIKKNEPFKVADSLTWSTTSQSGAGLVPRLYDSTSVSRNFASPIQLRTPLKDGLLNLFLWSKGIRLLQVQFHAVGANDTLQLVPGSLSVNSTALALLRGLDSLKSSLPQTREGILTLYGTLILAGDARIKGFPDSLPAGLPATEVIRAALIAASKTGKTLAEQAKTWSLGISTDSARSIVLKLIQSKTIAAKDSSTLFPPPPVRVKTHLSVGTGLRAGGVSVGVTGAFEWDEGLGLVAFQGVVTRDGKVDTNLAVYGLPVPKSTDRSASLGGSVSLLAKASAPEGTYMLTITAQDGASHTAVSSASFQVAAKLPDQPSSPRIRLVSPSDKSIVPFETAEVVTTWIAATPQGALESVKVEGTAAEKVNDSTWQAKVRLDPTGKARTIVAKVVNSAGLEAVATVDLTRQVDLTGPVVTWVSPTADLDVENGGNQHHGSGESNGSIGHRYGPDRGRQARFANRRGRVCAQSPADRGGIPAGHLRARHRQRQEPDRFQQVHHPRQSGHRRRPQDGADRSDHQDRHHRPFRDKIRHSSLADHRPLRNRLGVGNRQRQARQIGSRQQVERGGRSGRGRSHCHPACGQEQERRLGRRRGERHAPGRHNKTGHHGARWIARRRVRQRGNSGDVQGLGQRLSALCGDRRRHGDAPGRSVFDKAQDRSGRQPLFHRGARPGAECDQRRVVVPSLPEIDDHADISCLGRHHGGIGRRIGGTLVEGGRRQVGGRG